MRHGPLAVNTGFLLKDFEKRSFHYLCWTQVYRKMQDAVQQEPKLGFATCMAMTASQGCRVEAQLPRPGDSRKQSRAIGGPPEHDRVKLDRGLGFRLLGM